MAEAGDGDRVVGALLFVGSGGGGEWIAVGVDNCHVGGQRSGHDMEQDVRSSSTGRVRVHGRFTRARNSVDGGAAADCVANVVVPGRVRDAGKSVAGEGVSNLCGVVGYEFAAVTLGVCQAEMRRDETQADRERSSEFGW